MKSEVTDNNQTPWWKYPCLGGIVKKGKTQLVVLFLKAEEGIVIFDSLDSYGLGWQSKSWKMDNFTPLHPDDSVTLSND